MRVHLRSSPVALCLVAVAACSHHTAPKAVYSSADLAASGDVYAAPPLPARPAAGADSSESVAAVQAPAVAEEIHAVQSTYPLSRAARRRAARGQQQAPLAAATPSVPPDKAPALEPAKPETASDAVQVGPLLVYTASFLLSVYEVEKTQAALKQQVAALGGFVSMQTDTQITLRVPVAHFEQSLLAIEQAGKVRARQIQALDIGDEYRDLELRLHTAELLRQRLEAMLARADKVSEALQVQGELERIVREIEQLKGALRSFNDRIAYSTIVIEFRPEARPDIDDSEAFRLPFPFLDELGLHHLLELTP